MDFVDKGIDLSDEIDGINDIEFHSNVRENIVSSVISVRLTESGMQS